MMVNFNGSIRSLIQFLLDKPAEKSTPPTSSDIFFHVQINGAFGVDFTRDIKDAKTAEECLRKVGVGLLSHGELRTIVLRSFHEPASITQPRANFFTSLYIMVTNKLQPNQCVLVRTLQGDSAPLRPGVGLT